MTMRCDDGFHIGYFGDARRQRAGAALCERVVETGSLVLRHVGSDRRGEKSAPRFLASRDVTQEKDVPTTLHPHRSEEDTFELQSNLYLLCRLFLSKKKKKNTNNKI